MIRKRVNGGRFWNMGSGLKREFVPQRAGLKTKDFSFGGRKPKTAARSRNLGAYYICMNEERPNGSSSCEKYANYQGPTPQSTNFMFIFFLMMVAGMVGILWLVYRDVETAPWNRKKT